MKLSAIRTELERELIVRESAYPKWIEAGKISREDAEHRIATVKQAAAIIHWLDKAGADRVKASLAIMSLCEGKAHAAAMTLGLDSLKQIFGKYPDIISDLKDQVDAGK